MMMMMMMILIKLMMSNNTMYTTGIHLPTILNTNRQNFPSTPHASPSPPPPLPDITHQPKQRLHPLTSIIFQSFLSPPFPAWYCTFPSVFLPISLWSFLSSLLPSLLPFLSTSSLTITTTLYLLFHLQFTQLFIHSLPLSDHPSILFPSLRSPPALSRPPHNRPSSPSHATSRLVHPPHQSPLTQVYPSLPPLPSSNANTVLLIRYPNTPFVTSFSSSTSPSVTQRPLHWPYSRLT